MFMTLLVDHWLSVKTGHIYFFLFLVVGSRLGD